MCRTDRPGSFAILNPAAVNAVLVVDVIIEAHQVFAEIQRIIRLQDHIVGNGLSVNDAACCSINRYTLAMACPSGVISEEMLLSGDRVLRAGKK